MDRLNYIAKVQTLEEMQSFARTLAEMVEAGYVIALDGDLGAGKTTFSQAFARGLGVTETVNSPTFTIIKEYKGSSLPFYHMDVYRISIDEADELGLDEYFFGQGVSVVEWASIILDILPEHYLHITIELLPDQTRQMNIEGVGERYINIVKQLKDRGMTS